MWGWKWNLAFVLWSRGQSQKDIFKGFQEEQRTCMLYPPFLKGHSSVPVLPEGEMQKLLRGSSTEVYRTDPRDPFLASHTPSISQSCHFSFIIWKTLSASSHLTTWSKPPVLSGILQLPLIRHYESRKTPRPALLKLKCAHKPKQILVNASHTEMFKSTCRFWFNRFKTRPEILCL